MNRWEGEQGLNGFGQKDLSFSRRWHRLMLIGGFSLGATILALLPGTAQASSGIAEQLPQCGQTDGLGDYDPTHTVLVNKYRGVNSEGATFTRFEVAKDLGDLGQCPEKQDDGSLKTRVSCDLVSESPIISIRKRPFGIIGGNFGRQWLLVSKEGSRQFLVLDSSENGSWNIEESYPGFARPRGRFTELPVGPYRFSPGNHRFGIYNGNIRSNGMPRLGELLEEVTVKVSACKSLAS